MLAAVATGANDSLLPEIPKTTFLPKVLDTPENRRRVFSAEGALPKTAFLPEILDTAENRRRVFTAVYAPKSAPQTIADDVYIFPNLYAELGLHPKIDDAALWSHCTELARTHVPFKEGGSHGGNPSAEWKQSLERLVTRSLSEGTSIGARSTTRSTRTSCPSISTLWKSEDRRV